MSFATRFAIRRGTTVAATAASTTRRQLLLSRPSYRAFSTPPPPSPSASSGRLFAFGAVALTTVGAGVYFYSQSDSAKEASTALKSGAQAAKAAAGKVKSLKDYQEVYNHVASLLEASDYDDGSYGPVFVRLAWHSSGTYDKETGTGGSNYATMRFPPESLHGANNGLDVARTILEDVKKKFPWISYGDLWTLAGVAAIQEMQGPKIPWRAGRIDGFAKDVTPDGRLPDASKGSDHLRAIFYRMGFNDQEIVALSGGHALGRCHTTRSGFDGPWTFSPTTFTNAFFELLFNEKWQWKKWTGPKQLEDKKTGSLMMLPTDYVLVTDKEFKKWGKKYAEDEALFFKDFSSVFSRLLELGVPTSQFASQEPWELKTIDEQESK